MKNSTQWSNLYSTASKYNIQVFDSKTRPLLNIVGIALLIFIFVAMGIAQVDMVLVQYIALPVFILIFAMANIIYSKNVHNLSDESLCNFLFAFEIDDSGVVEYNKEHYHLHVSSRISIVGCWLTLESQNLSDKQLTKLFIFKDAVSAKSYSRLCRAINRTAILNESEAVI